MTDNKEIYSEKAMELNRAIDKFKKIRIPFISNSENIEISALLENYKDENSRNYIQKYAETEMNSFSSKMGEVSMVFAAIALILSVFMSISPQIHLDPIAIIVDLFFLIILIGWLFYIPFGKNLLKIIIMKIEDDKLNKQSEEVKLIVPETEASEKDLNINVEKFDLNMSISTEK